MTYVYNWKIRIGDTDFSGLVFTPKVIECIVEAVEDLMGEIGYPPEKAFEEGVVYPVVHAEADYIETLQAGDIVKVEVTPDVGNTSVTFSAVGKIGEPVFKGKIINVFILKEEERTISVPDDIKEDLNKIKESKLDY